MKKTLASAAALAIAANLVTAGAGLAAAQESGAPDATGSSALVPPLDAHLNKTGCKLTKEHPNPVILIHGTSDNATAWNKAAPQLAANGACVYAFDYGQSDVTVQAAIPGLYGLGDLNESAKQLSAEVDRVLAETGAKKVDLVGHSQGALLTKMYIKQMGGAEKVDRVVAIGDTFHGTTLGGADVILRQLIEAFPHLAPFFASTGATQQVVGTPLIEQINRLDDTAPGITYTSIFSPADRTATPNTTSMLQEVEGAHVANVNMKDVCGVSPQHPDLPKNPTAISLIKWGLDRKDTDTSVPKEACGDPVNSNGSSDGLDFGSSK